MSNTPTRTAVAGRFQSKTGEDLIQFVDSAGNVVVWIDCNGVLYNGPQFIAKDFKEFIRLSGMTHVRTSPYYPQSNGKIERWHKSLKGECIRPGTPLSLEDALRLVEGYVFFSKPKSEYAKLSEHRPSP
jgi:hypothetical protein